LEAIAMEAPRTRVSSVVLSAADPRRLAAFYVQLLGWTVVRESPGPREGFPPEDAWLMIRPAADDPAVPGFSLQLQWEPDYRPPVWPPEPGAPQMMLHLDIAVESLDEGVAWAVAAGATVAGHQPQKHVRVMLDPAGHPFCLWQGPV
jgi:catechol 2,3-dioxygenase-like lactoylglutathione lyase family enzyme